MEWPAAHIWSRVERGGREGEMRLGEGEDRMREGKY